ncbi:MAG: hypothetical protein A2Z91_00860 [Deltaproteobacteria bacterium GWA2_38_16]|nr:MAG: hypothetical protein A2Z91_00860 [Deltaproteobacteria bacterium GWA2_38_16]OGQ03647.1 MAG: hypothetical protein A3D19_02265 [Deltaproteobacteria bacterium RIFCSPHIGHO2_02_FULL_38_15]
MVQVSKFKWLEFEWDEHNTEELQRHSVFPTETEECFYNEHEVFRNKRKPKRKYETYKLIGKTNAGKKLLLIFFVKEKSTVRSSQGAVALIRVITGWEV